MPTPLLFALALVRAATPLPLLGVHLRSAKESCYECSPSTPEYITVRAEAINPTLALEGKTRDLSTQSRTILHVHLLSATEATGTNCCWSVDKIIVHGKGACLKINRNLVVRFLSFGP
jgi:hypothetical protein